MLGRHDTVVANAVFESGPILQLTTSYGMKTLHEPEIQVFALEGTIGVCGNRLELKNADNEIERIDCPWTHRKHDYMQEWLHFHDVVVNGAELAFKPEQAYGDILFMQKIIDAAKA
jgi:hypothetical protein